MSRPATLDDISGSLVEKRVIYAGETHDNYAHHLTQLELIKRIHQAHPDLAIGMEMFQRPFQQALDAFIGGSLMSGSFSERASGLSAGATTTALPADSPICANKPHPLGGLTPQPR